MICVLMWYMVNVCNCVLVVMVVCVWYDVCEVIALLVLSFYF